MPDLSEKHTVIGTTLACLVFWLALSLSESTTAEGDNDVSVVSVVQRAINEVATDMRSHEQLYKKDTGALQAMVAQRVMPYFGFTRITQLAMARNWASATHEQRENITREYRASFIRTYANALFLYRNVNPQFQLQAESTDEKATVKIKVKGDKGEPVTLFLRLEHRNQQWKIIDVNIEGVSLVIIARGQFADKIAKVGIDGLIQSLTEENAKYML